MNAKLKSVISNGLPWGVVFFALSFLIGYLFHAGTKSTVWMSAFVGGCALLLNGLLYNRFSKPLKDLEAISLILDDGELLFDHAPANHLTEEGLVPGKLFLTDKRMIFKTLANSDNKTRDYSWDAASLKPVNFYGSIWNAGGEFLLESGNGASLMFEVNKLKQWKDAFTFS